MKRNKSLFIIRIKVYNQEGFEDTNGVIRSRKSKKYRQNNGQRKGTKGQTAIYKTLHEKLKIEQQVLCLPKPEPRFPTSKHV